MMKINNANSEAELNRLTPQLSEYDEGDPLIDNIRTVWREKMNSFKQEVVNG